MSDSLFGDCDLGHKTSKLSFVGASLVLLAQDSAGDRSKNVLFIILGIVGGILLLWLVLRVGLSVLENANVIGPVVAGAGLLVAIVGYIVGAAAWVVIVGVVALLAGGMFYLSEGL